MSFDGTFLHFLIKEMQPKLNNTRINKIINISENELCLVMQSKVKLLLSFNPENPHMRFTNLEFINNQTPLSNFLKKKIENGIITSITQHENDRIAILDIKSHDDLGYIKNYKFILEFIGRAANLIITDENYIILEAIKKSFLTDERIIQPKVKYQFLKQEKINPFLYLNSNISENNFQGVSPLLYKEIIFENNLKKVLERNYNPTLFQLDKKVLFYCFDLKHLECNKIHFDTLSELLEYYFINVRNENIKNNDQKRISNFISKELTKLQNKLNKQQQELQEAYDNLKLEEIANVLAANIHLVKPYQDKIECYNFYTNENITIPLNTKIKPSENVTYYFNKYKKAKRTIENLNQAVEQTKNDIKYYETLSYQADLSNNNDLQEILTEVGISKEKNRKQKPNILKYIDIYGNIIYVGKNNQQNEYITFTLGNKDDYFFHVLNYPGSHVLFKGTLNEESIKIAATLAAHYSKLEGSGQVDYTQIKYVKKIKGMKGSFVHYTNQKSVHVSGNLETIKDKITIHK